MFGDRCSSQARPTAIGVVLDEPLLLQLGQGRERYGE